MDEEIKKDYIFASRTFEGFCKDNNISREEGLKALFGELNRLLKENSRRLEKNDK